MTPDGPAPSEDWQAADVHRLREYLGETQTEFAYRLGTRQQTVSEWETGASKPRRMARRLLHLVAEERGFYATSGAVEGVADGDADPSSAERDPSPGTDVALGHEHADTPSGSNDG